MKVWNDVRTDPPESGKAVLLACKVYPICGKPYYYICQGIYALPKTVICSGDDIECAEYDEDTDEYYMPEGWYEKIYNWDDYDLVAIPDHVTHWQRLPNAPKITEDNDNGKN